jgi:hypothetical protein
MQLLNNQERDEDNNLTTKDSRWITELLGETFQKKTTY